MDQLTSATAREELQHSKLEPEMLGMCFYSLNDELVQSGFKSGLLISKLFHGIWFFSMQWLEFFVKRLLAFRKSRPDPRLLMVVGLLLSHQIGPKLVASAPGDFGGRQ